jgi:cyclopropane fatty-acyl-phospholipid synthase-like methyltransferase
MFERSRRRERGYHAAFYAKHELGDPDTWVSAPAPYALDSFKLIPKRPHPRALDLGAGVGRHIIPLAYHLGAAAEVVCIDLLPSAVEKLKRNAKEAQLAATVTAIAADADTYEPQGTFDYVLSVSCIEHLPSKARLADLIGRLQQATNPGGVHCFMIATDHTWADAVTGTPVEPVVELNLSASETKTLLQNSYAHWEIQDISTKPWEERESLRGRSTICKSTCVQFVGIKPEEE